MRILLDQERELEINGFTIMKYEKETGKSLFKIGDDPSMTDIIYLVWAFLKDDLPVEQVAKSITFKNMKAISDTLGKLMGEAGNEKART
jgi:hypothetical protein